MKKKILSITIVFILAIMAVVGMNLNKINSKIETSLRNAEALADNEGGNEWESNYQYCRCKKDSTGKGCYGGNAISTRPSCHKAEPGVPVDCRQFDSNCPD